MILEIERRRENINAPSRMACLYVSRNLEDAKKWTKSFIYFGRPTFQIVKLKAIGNSFDGNSYNLSVFLQIKKFYVHEYIEFKNTKLLHWITVIIMLIT
ncbi:DUF2441 domain-containing protein [Clostridium perfringens]|uniref:DUF2441 domain-containing protein n=1 Tax=Clostridium perfringens TaxID=1502 RepID=UPI001FB0803F|nr:DUF2441 domain-containing protein [Clostridium perfringens]